MTKTEKKKIISLAKKKGTPLLDIIQWGESAVFLYQEGTKVKGYSYNEIKKGVRGEIRRLGR